MPKSLNIGWNDIFVNEENKSKNSNWQISYIVKRKIHHLGMENETYAYLGFH